MGLTLGRMLRVDDSERLERPRSTTSGDPCPRCGKYGTWSSIDPSALYTPPPGHTVHYLDEVGIPGVAFDTCPQELTSE